MSNFDWAEAVTIVSRRSQRNPFQYHSVKYSTSFTFHIFENLLWLTKN